MSGGVGRVLWKTSMGRTYLYTRVKTRAQMFIARYTPGVYLTQGLARICLKVSCLYCLAFIFSWARHGKVWIISNYIKYI